MYYSLCERNVLETAGLDGKGGAFNGYQVGYKKYRKINVGIRYLVPFLPGKLIPDI
jgi:hypothetical protein